MTVQDAQRCAVAQPLWPIFAAAFLSATAYGVTFLLPVLVAELGGNDADVGRILGLGAVGTLAFVTVSGHLVDSLGRTMLLALASLCLSLTVFGMAVAARVGLEIHLCGLLLGVGWGLVYTVLPILVTALSAAEARATRMMLLTAFVMLGIAGGPLLGPALGAFDLDVRDAFFAAAAASALGALLLWWAARRMPGDADRAGPATRLHRDVVLRVLRSEARWPLVMVALGASMFSALHHFQPTLAAAKGLPYGLFFVVYSIAVVGSRLVLANWIARQDIGAAATITLAVVTLSVAGIAAAETTVDYVIAVAALGGGYGLAYPLVKTLCANQAPDGDSGPALVLWSLSYFIGIFGFPLIAGPLLVAVGPWAVYAVLVGLCGLETVLAGWRWGRARMAHRRVSGDGLPEA